MLKEIKLDKTELRKEFSKDYKSYYLTKTFAEEGFKRYLCRICGKNFWSTEKRDTCDDPEHTEYSFFKEKPRPVGYVEFWKKFARFFEANGHTVIKKYPVVSRWRQDLYFTIASIQDFQRIENGAMHFEYSANPLVVPQMCLRFGDIENVGVTGRHLTSFMMAGQHAFNYPKEGYWRDRTIELDYKFLTKELGVKKETLTYNEDVWAMGDFSEFGPCLEGFSGGSELVNNVFTQFESVNGQVKELKAQVVDVGWGFERLLWFYTGFDNVYDAVFHDIIQDVKKKLPFEMDNTLFKKFARYASELDVTETTDFRIKEKQILKKAKIKEQEYQKKIKPMQALYATLDHTRTLLFAVSDGALPSNIGGGYNLRVILRRALGFIGEYEMGITLMEIAEQQAKELKGLYPELGDNLGILSKVIEVEAERYAKSTEHASRIINALIQKGQPIGREEIRTLYESHGVTPELITAVAQKEGKKIELPDGAYEEIMKGDFVGKEKAKKLQIEFGMELPKTLQLYYEFRSEADAKVLWAKDNYLVLDKTPFYPEGGGQAADRGTINGEPVDDVQKVGSVIVHVMKNMVDSALVGRKAECKVDLDRRERLMGHHTATHLISAASRAVLGKHAWQEGAHKDADKAHIDIAHYEKLSPEDVKKIEEWANNTIKRGIKVEVREMARGPAEEKYGFTIYQGHGVPAKVMRIVVITDRAGKLIDAEACGGMHVVAREGIIDRIKIINTARISDGVDRIEFVTGKAKDDYYKEEVRKLSSELQKLAGGSIKTVRMGEGDEYFEKEITTLRAQIQKLTEENLKRAKERREAEEEQGKAVAAEILSKIKGKETEIVLERKENREVLRKALSAVVVERPQLTVLAKNKAGEVVVMSGKTAEGSAIELARKTLGEKFRGGGSKEVAEGITK